MPGTNPPEAFYIGLMSGTSMDGIDAALVRITADGLTLEATRSSDLPADLRRRSLALCSSGNDEIDRCGPLARELGGAFADAALALLQESGFGVDQVAAIGSHGQTIRHRPGELGFSVQLGCPDTIATRTGLPVVADFRNRDMVLGGQGAPLVPCFHQQLFAQAGRRTAVVNIGGMANVTLLEGETILAGFDTGPGNALINHWSERHTGEPMDRDGAWAREGEADRALLQSMLDDPYFHASPPKSTGREYFHGQWLEQHLHDSDWHPTTVQATLTELTAQSITDALADFRPERILVCGGGAHNRLLMERLAALNAPVPVSDTGKAGMSPDWIEAAAFAWLAWARLNGVPGNAPAVTGASRAAVLGALYSA